MFGDTESLIYTDYERTKILIWESYEALSSFYGNWIIRKSLGKNTKDVRAGIKKSIITFLFQIKELIELKTDNKKTKQKILLEKEKYDLVINTIKKIQENKQLDEKTIHEIKDFSEYFMVESGIKQIVSEKLSPGRAMQRG